MAKERAPRSANILEGAIFWCGFAVAITLFLPMFAPAVHNVLGTLGIYYALMNLLGIWFALSDKIRASAGEWRISEFNLILMAALGAPFGTFLGMVLFNHKLNKKSFYIPVLITIVLHVGIFYYLIHNNHFKISA
jgi:uncharacterized membrane protein YsdA (DUF1294 family)